MVTVQSVVKEIKEQVVPSAQTEKEVKKKLKVLVAKVQKAVPQAKVILGGSGAKGTWLNSFDIDIFVKYPLKAYAGKSAELSSLLEPKIKKLFPSYERLHGSRNYFRVLVDGLHCEIVPILDITTSSQAVNITDVSPLHAKWVSKHKDIQNEIRVAKQFLRANRLYGAESHIKGFSGYVTEVLTIHYGSFLKFLRAVRNWKDKEIVDPEKYYRKGNVLLELNQSKLVSPLIVIDPVQKDRNAAAALSEQKFSLFKEKASEFLKKPSVDFFDLRERTLQDLKKEWPRKKIVEVRLQPLKGKEDVVGSKLEKAFSHYVRELERYGFDLYHGEFTWDDQGDAKFFFVLNAKPLEKTVLTQGPQVDMKKHVAQFKKKHKKTQVKKGRVVAVDKRVYVVAEDLIKKQNTHPYVKQRCKKAVMV